MLTLKYVLEKLDAGAWSLQDRRGDLLEPADALAVLGSSAEVVDVTISTEPLPRVMFARQEVFTICGSGDQAVLRQLQALDRLIQRWPPLGELQRP
jgi:hypothetical protein